jgi:hypothetical protein
MKKFLKYFLCAFAFVIFQLSLNNIVSAETINETYSNSTNYVNKDKKFPIPMLVKTEQISPNQIQISYDRDVDMELGMKATNYWIQDTMNDVPKGIATLGKNDKVNSKNSLTDNKVKIESKNDSAKTFVLTFNQDIPKGAEYKLIICYVTVEGAPAYNGDNGSATFVGK